jgi:hypothetical protein
MAAAMIAEMKYFMFSISRSSEFHAFDLLHAGNEQRQIACREAQVMKIGRFSRVITKSRRQGRAQVYSN